MNERFWQSLCSVSPAGAPMTRWKALAAGFRAIKPNLVSTGKRSRYVECGTCGCRHEVVVGGDEDLVAVCRCDPPLCEDIHIVDGDDLILYSPDTRRLFRDAVGVLPIQAQVRALADSPVWILGRGVWRVDGSDVMLVACLSDRGAVLTAAAAAVQRTVATRCIFLFGGENPEEVEELLPPGSRAYGLDDFLPLTRGVFSLGAAARRLLGGWPDEVGQTGAETGASRAGYWLLPRGQRKTRLNKEPYTLRTWRCVCDGRVFDLPDLVGSELLVRVLLERGRLFYADGLMRSLTGEAADVADERSMDWLDRRRDEEGDPDLVGSKRRQVAARQEVWDTKAIQREMDRIRTLRHEIAECGEGPAVAREKADMEKELDERVTGLQENTRPGPGGIPVPKTFDDDLKRAGNLVGKHFREVLAQLKETDEALWQHLSNKAILKYGQGCQYSTEKGYEWQTE